MQIFWSRFLAKGSIRMRIIWCRRMCRLVALIQFRGEMSSKFLNLHWWKLQLSLGTGTLGRQDRTIVASAHLGLPPGWINARGNERRLRYCCSCWVASIHRGGRHPMLVRHRKHLQPTWWGKGFFTSHNGSRCYIIIAMIWGFLPCRGKSASFHMQIDSLHAYGPESRFQQG